MQDTNKPEDQNPDKPGGHATDLPPNDPRPLEPHQYPVPIIVCSVVLIGMTLISLVSFPSDLTAARDLIRAQRLTNAGRLVDAISYYDKALRRVPSSKVARLGMAQVLFALKSQESDRLAMAYLENLRMSRSEFERISVVMPEHYRKQFTYFRD